MSDLQIQVINAETEDNLTGIVIDGVPHLYWLRIYKALGITKAHAVEVIKRLTEGVHYRKFTKEELHQLSGTVNDTLTVDMRAHAFYFLTAEGYNRAIMEIGTEWMDNKEIAEVISAKKDHIASVYTRYQAGETLSLASDEAKKELPGDVDATAITNENLAIADSFIKYACHHLKIDPGLVISASLTHAEQEIQRRGGNTDLTYLKGMIPRMLPGEPATLNATDIGKYFDLPPKRVNDILLRLGLQEQRYRKSHTSGEFQKYWSPTEKGEPHGEWKPITKGHKNGSVHHGHKWYWKESILNEMRTGLFGDSSGQQQLAVTA